MAYRVRGKLEEGTTFSVRLGGAQNFMAALSAAGKILADRLGAKAGTVIRFSIAVEENVDTFRVGKSKGSKGKK